MLESVSIWFGNHDVFDPDPLQAVQQLPVFPGKDGDKRFLPGITVCPEDATKFNQSATFLMNLGKQAKNQKVEVLHHGPAQIGSNTGRLDDLQGT
jgi:hypothetical protein